MNQKLLSKIAAQELKKREEIVPINVLMLAFDKQLEFIKSPAKRKVLCLTRRAAKSTAAALYLIDEALKTPRSKLIYIHLTKAEAKNTMWTNIFEEIFLKLNIPAELVGLEIRFDNGSIIYLAGVDSTQKEMNKLRGKKYKLAIIDEAQSFTQDLEQLINSVLGPTLADANATLCLLGTPGNKMGRHFWWKINKPDTEEKGWTFFHWTWKENPFVRDNMQKHINDLISHKPKIVEDPSFRQEYLGEWVIENNARVYKTQNYNYINNLPEDFIKNAIYNFSMDLGYEDGTAFVITAYNKKFNNKLYVLESIKKCGIIISEIANLIIEYRKKYNFQHMIVDAGAQGKMIVETLKREYRLPLEAASKLGKEGHIALLNSDFNNGNICIIKEKNQELIHELETLLWDEKLLRDGIYEEDQTMPNDICDTLLYSHNASRHYWYKESAPIIPLEEKIIIDIEKQLGFNKPKFKTLKRPFWETNEY